MRGKQQLSKVSNKHQAPHGGPGRGEAWLLLECSEKPVKGFKRENTQNDVIFDKSLRPLYENGLQSSRGITNILNYF